MKLFVVLSLFIVSNTVFVFAQKNLTPKKDISKSLGKIETEAYFPGGELCVAGIFAETHPGKYSS